MSPAMQMATHTAYTPSPDAMDRHEYGITKNRKPASTGGGRAWSDDEEVYLLQTRLQKMPYKHIAAHLKKTELACRLHYHQLSHGSNRRKRTTSVSSSSSAGGHSPILPASVPSPIHETSPTPSPPGSSAGYGAMSGGVQLPSIMAAGPHGHSHGTASPHLPTILPKPVSMTLAMAGGSPTMARGYPPGLSDGLSGSTSLPPANSAPLLPAPTFTTPTPTSTTTPSSATPSLRLDCTALPLLPPSATGPHHPVDMARLQSVYGAHRSVFWATVAAEYGHGANPVVLEQAWRSASPGLRSCSSGSNSSSGGGSGLITSSGDQRQQQQTATPLTPGTSLDDRDLFYGAKGSQDRTRISAILGIDANPRSPKEREMVRRLEEERVVVPATA